ncbi:precorrin-6A synthase (deacetylating) [Rhodobacteraceae bacterium HSP-20]|uniref:Precorrin-6A synthase [deacetylating] n=1 Tax=Paragemmobacter amnigenus TaxID=2852097 RepID=A0ABS6J5E8_9RHOB|nr:precorrin-6A synthase (deacetylating) [Rhodobacter amnigenus]MBU9698968.1 precorrin-6A synthase (deacetylating) [Rhodobacter amnigenus]MBV4390195.1 precorrin-6A synthase (deacetylating) [Rhodobacter amnigenus]
MIDLTLIGIGTGNLDHVTLQAIKAMNTADLILIPLKGEDKSDLAGLRQQIFRTCVTNPATRIDSFDLPERDPGTPDYLRRVNDWHDQIAAVWHTAIERHLAQGGGPKVAFLVWGDPSLYDSTLRIAERLSGQRALHLHVIPGITAIQALCAAHAIPLNDLAAPVTITTGRQLRESGWPPGAETVVVMLDNGGAFGAIDPEGVSIWWGAYVGMDRQVLVSGPLEAVAGQISETRARIRSEHGWVMDIYLMRRKSRQSDFPKG